MNSQAQTKRCLHVFIFNFFASLILFSSNSVWALTGKEARDLGQGMISYSTNIQGIGKANLDAYRQIIDYDTNSNLGISAMKRLDSDAIQTMREVNLGNINLLEAANTFLNYSDSLETYKAIDKGRVVVNEIENQLQDKLRRRKNYSVTFFVYARQHEKAINQNSSLLDFIVNETKSIARASVAGWKTARATFLDEDKLIGKKVGAAIAVTESIDSIQTLFSLGTALIDVMSQDNLSVEDMTKVLSDISDLANKTKTSSGSKLISAIIGLNKNIARLKSIKKNNHDRQPDLLKYTLRIAEQKIVEDILSNVDDMLEVFAKTAGLEKEMEAFTSTRKLFNRGELDLVQMRLENKVSNAKAGRVPLDDGIRKFQAAASIFESDLGAVIDREPKIKDDVFGISESYNYDEYSPAGLASLENMITGQEQQKAEDIRTTQLDQQENQRQAEDQATQGVNDDQRMKTVNLAVKQRANDKAEKNLTKRSVTRVNKTNSGAGNTLSAADRQKLLSGNYALATHMGVGYYSSNALIQESPYNLPLRSGSSSLTLRFPELKESVPNSDPAKGNTLVPSDRIKIHARDYGDYSYIAWGAWSSGENTRIRPFEPTAFPFWEITLGGNWIYGQKLRRADIPRSGSARYIGQVKGFYDNPDIVEMNSITGDINMAVTFRDNNLSLSGVMNLDRNGKDWATPRFNNPNATTHYETSQFQFGARLSVDVYERSSGHINGSFFGANAAEVGGTFYVSKIPSSETAQGVFRAKKQ